MTDPEGSGQSPLSYMQTVYIDFNQHSFYNLLFVPHSIYSPSTMMLQSWPCTLQEEEKCEICLCIVKSMGTFDLHPACAGGTCQYLKIVVTDRLGMRVGKMCSLHRW